MHPILFEIPTPWGGVPIYSYGVMLGTSMIIAWYVVMWLGQREGFDRETLANGFIVAAVSAILGARLLYVATNPHDFNSVASVFALRRGGLVAYGGFLGGFFGALAYLRHKKVSFLGFADVTAPTLALGLALTRIGCYLYGCDFGARLDESAPEWLRTLGTFPHWPDDNGSPAWSHHVAEYGLDFQARHSFPVHPTQLYESAAGFVLFGLTLLVWSRRSFRGQVLLSLAVAYGVWRFGIEYLRDDPERGELFGLSTSQLISLAIVPVAAFFYQQARKEQRASGTSVMRLWAPETYAPIPRDEGAPLKRDRDADQGEREDDDLGPDDASASRDGGRPSARAGRAGPKKKRKKP
jgi:phosphatidylglycerol:prolipoprotein diacylglycerol transferase